MQKCRSKQGTPWAISEEVYKGEQDHWFSTVTTMSF